MGIPFYFSQLVRKHGVQFARRGGAPPPCDVLCYDYNCLIHTAAAVAIKAGARDHRGVFAEIRRRTVEIARDVRPTGTVLICVDGVPPLAKMYQQRKRRYMGMKERRAGARRGWWNPNAVTPGTAFMAALDAELLPAVVADLRAELGDGVEVVCSSWREDGEGEHKIFERLAGAMTPAGTRVVIHGLDADMIMLSLLHPELEITLMREDDRTGVLMWVSIRRLAALVGAEVGGADRVLDYVVLCMLAGNDFLPPVSYVSVPNGDIGEIVRRHAEAGAPRLAAREPDAAGNHVRFDALAAFLGAALVPDEDVRMRAAHDAYFSARVPRRGPEAPAEHRWKFYPLLHKQAGLGGLMREPRGWRARYYDALLDAPPHAVAARFLEGLEWNVRYYLTNRAPRAQWFYEHTHGPTFLDLHNLLVGAGPLRRGWEAAYTSPCVITPEVQLACVTPPVDAVALLPPRARRLFTDVALGCTHLFPDDFQVPTYLRSRVWECHPRLPPIDLVRVCRALAKDAR